MALNNANTVHKVIICLFVLNYRLLSESVMEGDLWIGKKLPKILGKVRYIGKNIIYFVILNIYKFLCCIVSTQFTSVRYGYLNGLRSCASRRGPGHPNWVDRVFVCNLVIIKVIWLCITM